MLIQEGHRNKGCAKKLMQEILNWFKSMRINHISLDVDVNNLSAIQLYKKYGFRKSMYKMSLVLK